MQSMQRAGVLFAVVAAAAITARSARADDEPRGRRVFFRAGVGPAFGVGSISEKAEGGTVYGAGFATELAVGGRVRPDMAVGGAFFTTNLIQPTYDITNTNPVRPSHEVGVVGNHYVLGFGSFLDWEPTRGGPWSVHGAVYLAAVSRSRKYPTPIHYEYLQIGQDDGAIGGGAMVGAAYRIMREEGWNLEIVGRVQYLAAVFFAKVPTQLHLVMPAVLLSVTYR
jgi:hypothetical protein